jgi:biopolymer transport protein ExbD
MKINLDSPVQETRIEVVPLIDVIFCILIFFILAAVGLTRQQAINLDLPKASTGASQTREMLVVSIDPVGLTYVENQPVSREQLTQALQNYIRTRPGGLIVLNASQLVSYNNVIQVLDLLRSVGGDRVALATQPADPSPSPASPGAPPPPTANPNLGNPAQPQLLDPGQAPGGGEVPLVNPTQPQVPLSPGQSPDEREASP